MSASTSDSLTTTGSVALSKAPTDTTAFVTVSGTYGTVTFVIEGSVDGTLYFPLAAIAQDTGAVVTGTIAPSDNTTRSWKVACEGLSNVRLRTTAVTTGTLAVAIQSSSYVGVQGPLTVSNAGTFGAVTHTGDVLLNDSVSLELGTGSDIVFTWDGTDLDITQATANSSIKWGVDAAGIDHVFYGDTASANMTWDQSADSLLLNGAAKIVCTGTFTQGSDTTDRVALKGIYRSPANVSVTVPTIADGESDEVAVDVSGAFSFQPAVGDHVIATPVEALPTDCVLAGAWVSGTDEITVTFTTKEGGSGVTGAAKNFRFLVFDVT